MSRLAGNLILDSALLLGVPSLPDSRPGMPTSLAALILGKTSRTIPETFCLSNQGIPYRKLAISLGPRHIVKRHYSESQSMPYEARNVPRIKTLHQLHAMRFDGLDADLQ